MTNNWSSCHTIAVYYNLLAHTMTSTLEINGPAMKGNSINVTVVVLVVHCAKKVVHSRVYFLRIP